MTTRGRKRAAGGSAGKAAGEGGGGAPRDERPPERHEGRREEPREGRRSERRAGRSFLPIVGWREWAVLPDLGAARVKAKVDTGARTSALHALDIEPFERDGEPWVRFVVPLRQGGRPRRVRAETPLHDERRIRSSNGAVEERPIVRTGLELAGRRWEIEVSLTRRDEMGFRMLLGREALRGRVLVDPGRSFAAGGGALGKDPAAPGAPAGRSARPEEEA